MVSLIWLPVSSIIFIDTFNVFFRYQLIGLPSTSLSEIKTWWIILKTFEVAVIVVLISDCDRITKDRTRRCYSPRKLFEITLIQSFSTSTIFGRETERLLLTHCEWFQDFSHVVNRHRHRSNGSNTTLDQLTFCYMRVRGYSTITGGKWLFLCARVWTQPCWFLSQFSYGDSQMKWGENHLHDRMLYV